MPCGMPAQEGFLLSLHAGTRVAIAHPVNASLSRIDLRQFRKERTVRWYMECCVPVCEYSAPHHHVAYEVRGCGLQAAGELAQLHRHLLIDSQHLLCKDTCELVDNISHIYHQIG